MEMREQWHNGVDDVTTAAAAAAVAVPSITEQDLTKSL